MPRAEVRDASLHYETEGRIDAPVVVLSHALGTSSAMWWPQRRALSVDYRVLMYDGRGHGASDCTPGPYRIEQLAQDVLDLTGALGIDRFDFCGLSMGGAIGLWLGANAPDRIGRLAVANTAAKFAAPEAMNARIETVRRDGMRPLVDGILERWFTPAFRVGHAVEIERIRTLLLASPADGYAANCAAVRDVDLREDLARVRVPTLVISGAADPGTTPALACEIADGVAGSRLESLPASHLSNIECATDFNALLSGFFCR